MRIGKLLRDAALWGRLLKVSPQLAPLEIKEDGERTMGKSHADGFLQIRWGQDEARFAYEAKEESAPRAVEMAMVQAVRHAREAGVLPMVVVPYLREERLTRLAEEEISGLDLCGNAVILAPGMRFWRSGRPNLYPSSSPIKNVFRGTSSLVARCFLLQSTFGSSAELHRFVVERKLPPRVLEPEAPQVAKGTISKVVQALAEELIVMREGSALRLVDPQRLLAELRSNYRALGDRRAVGRVAMTPGECWKRLREEERHRLSSVTTGVNSAGRYGVLSTSEQLSVYVNDLDRAASVLGLEETRVFPNVELVETGSETPYFDARREGDVLWASPVQSWIELAIGGPRERDAATILERELMQGGAERWIR